jgi:hypothetical protein
MGGYYSLDMSSILTDNYPMLYGNETITVEGMLVPKAMLARSLENTTSSGSSQPKKLSRTKVLQVIFVIVFSFLLSL